MKHNRKKDQKLLPLCSIRKILGKIRNKRQRKSRATKSHQVIKKAYNEIK